MPLRGPHDAHQPEAEDGAEGGHDEAIEVESGYTGRAEGVEDESADERADDTDDHVAHDTLGAIVAHDE